MVRAAMAAERSGSRATWALSRVGTKPGQTELQHTPEENVRLVLTVQREMFA